MTSVFKQELSAFLFAVRYAYISEFMEVEYVTVAWNNSSCGNGYG